MRDNINHLSYDEGFKKGYSKGFGDGQNKSYEKGYRIGMDIGYNKGYKEGYEYGFEKGYREGNNLGYNMGFLGGLKEKDVRYQQGYEVGYKKGFDSAFNRLSTFTGRLIDVSDVFSLIKNAYIEGKTLSLVRIDDKDILNLEDEDSKNRDIIDEILKRASIVGVPTSHIREYQLYLLDILEKEGFKLQELIITDRSINWALLVNIDFITMLVNEKVRLGTLLNQGKDSLMSLTNHGLNVVEELYLDMLKNESLEGAKPFGGCDMVLNFCGLKGLEYLWNNTYNNKLITLDLGDESDYFMERIKDV